MDWLDEAFFSPAFERKLWAEWDAWERVEELDRAGLQSVLRDGFTRHGVLTVTDREVDVTITRLVGGWVALVDPAAMARWEAMSAARKASRSERERGRARVVRAVQVRAGGMDTDRIRAELAGEYAARGVREVDEVELTMDVRRVRPWTAREKAAGYLWLARGAVRLVRAIRVAPRVDPEAPKTRQRWEEEGMAEEEAQAPPGWARPPAGAVAADGRDVRTAVRVVLDPGAGAVFSRLREQWTTGLRGALLEPWLDSGEPAADGRVVPHLGQEVVGVLPEVFAQRLGDRVATAQRAGAPLTVEGLLVGDGSDDSPWVFRVAVPRS